MVELQARDLEVRGSNPGPGSNFLLNINCNSSRHELIGLHLLVNLIVLTSVLESVWFKSTLRILLTMEWNAACLCCVG